MTRASRDSPITLGEIVDRGAGVVPCDVGAVVRVSQRQGKSADRDAVKPAEELVDVDDLAEVVLKVALRFSLPLGPYFQVFLG